MTAFADVARYSKLQPSLMPDVNTTLRTITPWRYLIKTDLTQAFYQIPLSQSSLKYCGVATPCRGIRVYTRSAMSMPGSETALEEMICRVLGYLIQEGCVTKLADDLYCGGDSPGALLSNWRRVLESLDRCNLRLSATKTILVLLDLSAAFETINHEVLLNRLNQRFGFRDLGPVVQNPD